MHDGQVLQSQRRVQQVQGEDLGIREVVVVGAGGGYRVGGGESGEACRIVQLAFGMHVHVRTGSFEAGIDVGLVEVASVGVDRDRFLYGLALESYPSLRGPEGTDVS